MDGRHARRPSRRRACREAGIPRRAGACLGPPDRRPGIILRHGRPGEWWSLPAPARYAVQPGRDPRGGLRSHGGLGRERAGGLGCLTDHLPVRPDLRTARAPPRRDPPRAIPDRPPRRFAGQGAAARDGPRLQDLRWLLHGAPRAGRRAAGGRHRDQLFAHRTEPGDGRSLRHAVDHGMVPAGAARASAAVVAGRATAHGPLLAGSAAGDLEGSPGLGLHLGSREPPSDHGRRLHSGLVRPVSEDPCHGLPIVERDRTLGRRPLRHHRADRAVAPAHRRDPPQSPGSGSAGPGRDPSGPGRDPLSWDRVGRAFAASQRCRPGAAAALRRLQGQDPAPGHAAARPGPRGPARIREQLPRADALGCRALADGVRSRHRASRHPGTCLLDRPHPAGRARQHPLQARCPRLRLRAGPGRLDDRTRPRASASRGRPAHRHPEDDRCQKDRCSRLPGRGDLLSRTGREPAPLPPARPEPGKALEGLSRFLRAKVSRHRARRAATHHGQRERERDHGARGLLHPAVLGSRPARWHDGRAVRRDRGGPAGPQRTCPPADHAPGAGLPGPRDLHDPGGDATGMERTTGFGAPPRRRDALPLRQHRAAGHAPALP